MISVIIIELRLFDYFLLQSDLKLATIQGIRIYFPSHTQTILIPYFCLKIDLEKSLALDSVDLELT